MPPESALLTTWLEKNQNMKIRKNARIPKDFEQRRQIYKLWKKNVDPEELRIRSDGCLYNLWDKSEIPKVRHPECEKNRIYYAEQYEKDSCPHYIRLYKKLDCEICVATLSIYSTDKHYPHLVNMFSKVERVKLEVLNDWYIVSSKNVELAKDLIMDDLDVEPSELVASAVDVEEEEDIVETPIVGNKRARVEVPQPENIVDLDLLEPPAKVVAIPENGPADFHEALIRAIFFRNISEKAKSLKPVAFVDEEAYQQNPFAFLDSDDHSQQNPFALV